ncbi:hypothetical protein HUG10_09475 [Halorarum halophilum]|uniref:Tat pathway signal protein n=1 Tax=Halorarum halophilum TaxID=2743090 RepID=A0A7D5GXG6_9EURY|nr:hypothetical protein [Halobaculum halophilum]QLG27769.1 hypothetical protein HUG10_09475 [Halobaculum halophilum]
MPSRRSLLGRLSAAVGVAAAGCAGLRPPPGLDLPANPHDVPRRQFAQRAHLREDADGNPLGTRFRRVLLLDLQREPSAEAGRTVERALRTLEDAYDWSPDGLFHLLAWGTNYLDDHGVLNRVPTDHPTVLSRVDTPELLRFDAALVLESDVPSHLTAAESALFGDRAELNGVAVDHRLLDTFARRERRTGFIGEGLPAAHADAEGVPADAIPEDAPMFTGFQSGREKTQASEDRVTIDDGPLEGGTTMHLSHLTLNLKRWYAFSEASRVKRMFDPETTPDDEAGFTDDVPFADRVEEHASEHGMVGHHEKVARVRRDGEPLLLRRDFNTVDGGHPGVHFLAFQRAGKDFRRTRKSMNGWYLRDDSPDITDSENNGILDVIRVRSRANFVVPPREKRAFPLTVT